MIISERRRSPPRVIGSPLLKAVRNGFFQLFKTSQAWRQAGVAGSLGEVGTIYQSVRVSG